MSADRTLGVVGAGNMGSGIAQKMAMEGFDVILVDLGAEQVERGMKIITDTLDEAVERRIMKPAGRDATLARVEGTTDWSRLAKCEMVVEAVFENLEVKRDVFRRLGEHCRDDCILGTNTSSFYVRDVAEVVPHPERVVGLHYFYHPAKNRLVEVVPTEKSSDDAVRRGWAIQEAIGKTPIHSADAPGFVVNRYFVPWLNEAVRLLEEGAGNIPTIEQAAKNAFKIGMGPFELMNVTGVPIALHAATTLGQELGDLYTPAEALKAQVEKGEKWNLSGEQDPTGFARIEERLLGVIYLVAGQLVDENVGSIEDVDIGARVGLRWNRGPFELMNGAGTARAAGLAKDVAERYGATLPKVLAAQEREGRPFPIQVVTTENKNDVGIVSFNRPDVMNAINEEVVGQLETRFAETEADDAVKGIVLAGKGKGFVAGADIRFFVQNIQRKRLDSIQTFTEKGQEVIARFAASPKTVVARLHGLSLGGGSEIAMACDYIVATPKGSLGFPETGIGIYPGLGGTQRLTRRVGVPLARWLVLTGAPVDAKGANAMGLVDTVASFEDLDATCHEFALRDKPDRSTPPTTCPAGFESLWKLFEHDLDDLLATDPGAGEDVACQRALKALRFKAPIALRLADRLIREGAATDLAAGLAMELSHLEEIFSTADAFEGLSKVGKARPEFVGK